MFFKFWVCCFKFQVSGLKFKVSGLRLFCYWMVVSGVFRQAQCDSLVAMFFKFWVCCFRFQVLGFGFVVYGLFCCFDGGVLSTNKKDVFLYF